MIIDTTPLAAEISRFEASVQKLADALKNSDGAAATIADLQAQLATAQADDAANAATIADLTARLKAANDAVGI